MNILVMSWRGPGHPLSGGAEQATLAHMSAWKKNGNNVTLFTSSFPGAKKYDVIQGINIMRFGDQYFGVKLGACFWYLFINKQIFDVVIDEFHGIPFFTPLYVRRKIIAYIHETGTKVWALNFWTFPLNLLPTIFGPIVEKIVFKYLYKNKQFMTVSESTKKDLKLFGINNIKVIHNGVLTPDKLPYDKKYKTFTILYLSALAQDKGTEDAIIAFEAVHKVLPDAQLLIAGKGEKKYLSYLKTLSSLPKYLGYVSEQEKFKLMSKSHLLIFPSLHEGWGLVIIEANSMGLPVIGYDVSGTRDAIINNKTGILCKVGDISELVATIIELQKNKKKRSELSVNAKSWASKFNWTLSGKRSMDLLEDLVYNRLGND